MNTFHKLALVSAIALGATVFSGTSQAGTDTANLGVSATVVNSCDISATGAVAFGDYDPAVVNASADLDNTGTISVTCTSGAAVTITLDQGANPNTGSTLTAPDRRMIDGGTNYLSYDLYSDSARSVVWGGDATVDVATTGTGTAEAHTVYGRVAGGQNVPAGSYTDTVVATVTF